MERADAEWRQIDVGMKMSELRPNLGNPMVKKLDKRQSGEESDKMKTKIEMAEDDGDKYLNGINDPFLCYICLELVCKPVVNACGHMFCFWCVHLSMNNDKESNCPLCRRPYKYFPRVCDLLHFFLLKAMPDEYRERCKDNDDDSSMQLPHYGDALPSEVVKRQVSGDGSLGQEASLSQHSFPASEGRKTQVVVEEDTVTVRDCQDQSTTTGVTPVCSSSTSVEEQGVESTGTGRGDSIDETSLPNCSSTSVTVADVLCGSCAKLLYRPVVLNCGHVFCQSCLATKEDEDGPILTCSTCGSLHPGDFPLVCLELHHYLEQHFCSEYGVRRVESEAQSQEMSSSRSQSTVDATDEKHLDSSEKSRMSAISRQIRGQRTHASLGCDGCGMYPIIGQRYRCTTCHTPPGYDLCSNCYKSGKNLLGRFNQKHTEDHELECCDGASIFVRELFFQRLRLPDTWRSISSGESPFSEDPDDLPYSEEPSESLIEES